MEPMFSGPVTYDEGFTGLKSNMDPKERFYRHFEGQTLALQEEIANLGNISASGGERRDATDHVLDGVSRLTNEVADASEYAPPRDQMIYGQALKALREQLNIQTRSLGPESRFRFTQQSKEALISATNGSQAATTTTTTTTTGAGDYNAEMARGPGTATRKPSFSRSREVDISGHQGMHIILPPTAGRATSSGSVTGLSGCVVDLSSSSSAAAATTTAAAAAAATGAAGGAAPPPPPPPPPPTLASLTIRDVSRSLIVAGRVAGPAHVTGARRSVIVVDARQVRMHGCSDVAVYLWCGSHPIIEDCSRVRFAPVPDAYRLAWRGGGGGGGGGVDGDGDGDGDNQWDRVDDFNWLKAEASPNWSRLPEASRLPGDFWTDTVRGGPLLGTEDILRRAGI